MKKTLKSVVFFRLKIHEIAPIFRSNEKKKVVLDAIKNAPEYFSDEERWEITTPKSMDDEKVMFRFGRHVYKEGDDFDKENKDFVRRDILMHNFVEVYVDMEHQVIAITEKPSFKVTSKKIASTLQDIINKEIEHSNYLVKIVELIDPSEFIEEIRGAYQVRSFRATIGLPNDNLSPKDLLQNPAEKMTREFGATETKIQIINNDGITKIDLIISSVKHLIAVGFEFGASIIKKPGGKPISINQGRNVIKEQIEEKPDMANEIYARIKKIIEKLPRKK